MLIYVFNFDLFEFSAAILEKDLLARRKETHREQESFLGSYVTRVLDSARIKNCKGILCRDKYVKDGNL